jgi:hypothetical protein
MSLDGRICSANDSFRARTLASPSRPEETVGAESRLSVVFRGNFSADRDAENLGVYPFVFATGADESQCGSGKEFEAVPHPTSESHGTVTGHAMPHLKQLLCISTISAGFPRAITPQLDGFLALTSVDNYVGFARTGLTVGRLTVLREGLGGEGKIKPENATHARYSPIWCSCVDWLIPPEN